MSDTKLVYHCTFCFSTRVFVDACKNLNTGEVCLYDEVSCEICGNSGHNTCDEIEVDIAFDPDVDELPQHTEWKLTQ